MTSNSVRQILDGLTLEEKAALSIGATPWQTLAVDRLGLPHITVADGPHGVRRSVDAASLISSSHPATCYPVAAALAATWDKDLLYELGQALGEECLALDVDILLGPGINIKRSPLCGRNFEYLSEDPLLAGELSASLIQGVQSKGVGTSLKHFAVNNQETRRFTMNAVVDERTLHEIYLTGFEIAVKRGKPWTVMCAYNKLNGERCAESPSLLTSILRDQWGFEGFVMSDWGAVWDRVASLRAGLDLQMPGPSPHGITEVVEAVRRGQLDEAVLDRTVERLLSIVLRARATHKTGTFDVDAHHALARRIASEAVVLLKNEGGLLPLSGDETVAVIGKAALMPVFQGGGSSHVKATRVDAPVVQMQERAEVHYAACDDMAPVVDAAMIAEAVTVAKDADVAVLFIALPSRIESEGYDRADLDLTPQQVALIQAVAAVQPRTVVVLNNGSAVNMQPWIDSAPAVLEAWLPGQAGAAAVVDVLYGAVNPSGRLAETFPLDLSDTPPYLNFPGENDTVRYGEGLFVGYRGYEALDRPVLFPFGFGLSYTRFAYSNLRVSHDGFTYADTITVSVDVANTGARAGKEVVQLYVADPVSRLRRPVKELKAFAKVALEPGETKTVEMTLDARAFSYYDPVYGQWIAEAGEFEIAVGASSADIRLRKTVTLTEGTPVEPRLHRDSPFRDWLAHPRSAALVEPLRETLFGEGQSLDSDELGADSEAFFGDLPLHMVLGFSGLSAGMSPAQLVDDLLAKLHGAGEA
ncbi:MAG: glycoside hydrolase family 3 C-terminal domain-containing protein [Chloroflexi bacterium]|nr:glycoside hydrolase family 3 C-terminal domain-containing protein [Chloroflexota bacterium]